MGELKSTDIQSLIVSVLRIYVFFFFLPFFVFLCIDCIHFLLQYLNVIKSAIIEVGLFLLFVIYFGSFSSSIFLHFYSQKFVKCFLFQLNSILYFQTFEQIVLSTQNAWFGY